MLLFLEDEEDFRQRQARLWRWRLIHVHGTRGLRARALSSIPATEGVGITQTHILSSVDVAVVPSIPSKAIMVSPGMNEGIYFWDIDGLLMSEVD